MKGAPGAFSREVTRRAGRARGLRAVGVLACVLVACGGVPTEGEDAGTGRLDAGSLVSDAGHDVDAGLPGAGVPDAGAPDAGASDAGLPDAGSPPPVDAGTSVLRYPAGRTQSPLTPEVVEHLRAIAALAPSKKGNVFSKVGDSNTVNTNYLSCFAGSNVDLAGRTALQPALTHFLGGAVGGTTSFDRVSLSATVGWSAFSALTGTPSPLQQELDTAQPRYATVMFGTNDVGFADTHSFGRNLFTIIDTLSLQGVVPVVSSIPPRDDSATADAWVPRYNLVARGVAQARRVPFVDLHRELLPLTAHGLGGDGVHLNVYTPTGARGCVFTSAGLGSGHNTRNLATLTALDRAWRAVSGGTAADATAPRIAGSGKPGDEVVIESLPFVDVRDTRTDGVARIGTYPGCGSAANEAGREVLYRLVLTQQTNLRVFVVSLGTADIDVHLMSATGSGADCLQRADKVLTRAVQPGTYYLSLDTYQGTGGLLPGEYLVGVLAE